MEDLFSRVWGNLVGRVGGPMSFRLVLQPLMASLLALRAGLKDAREERSPYLHTILTDPIQRPQLLLEGGKSIARVFILAIAMDIIYQLIVERWIYPGEILIVALLLAIVPYILIRGPITRIARRLIRH